MHRTSVVDEVHSRPGKAREELGGKEVAFKTITARAGEDQVARYMCAAVRERMYMIQRREIEFEPDRAVDAATTAVAHSGSFDGSFLMPCGDRLGPARSARGAGEGGAVELPTTGQCHLAKKEHPADGIIPVAGCRAN
jgi:hypothetical protein